MGNACTNCSACVGDKGENGEILTHDRLGNTKGGKTLTTEEINYFAQHVEIIIRLQAWCRGVVTRERIRA